MFAQLLQNLGSYLDFSKRLATTVPGLVMALALVMLTATVPDWAQQPFACGEVKSLEEQWNDAEHQLETSGSEGYLDRSLHVRESALRRAYYSAVNGAEWLPDRADAAAKAYQALQAFYSGDGAHLIQERKNLTDAKKKNAEAALDSADRKLAENRYAAICHGNPKWSDVASDLLMFGLLGFTFGVVFDPVNKAIFLQKLPEVVAPENTDSSAEGSKKPSRMAFLARAFVPAEHALKRNPRKLQDHTVQFYVGRGLITNGEYQEGVRP